MRASPQGVHRGRATVLAWLAGVALGAAVACGGDDGGSPDASVDGPAPTLALDTSAAEVGLMSARTFVATVTGLADARVRWSVTGVGCAGEDCGIVDSAGRYRGPWCLPTPPRVTVTATAVAQPSLTASAEVTLVLGPATFVGDYAFHFEGTTAEGTLRAIGRFSIDASGAVSAGVEDVALATGLASAVTFTGTATQTCFRRGTITFHDGLGRSSTFAYAMDGTGSRGRFIELDASGQRGAGVVVRQDPAAIAAGRLPAALVVALTGRLATAAAPRVGLVGRMHAGASALSGGVVDLDVAGAITAAAPLTGSYTLSTATGRGTATWSLTGPAPRAFALRFYLATAGESFWLGADPPSATTPLWSGTALAQSGGPFSPAALAGPLVLELGGKAPDAQAADALLGVLDADGQGAITGGVVDENDDTAVTSTATVSGSYTVAADSGRGTLHLALGAASRDLTFYLLGPGRAVVQDGTAAVAGPHVGVGRLTAQVGGPFPAAALTGAYVLGTTEVATPFIPLASGVVFVDDGGLARGLGDSSTVFANTAGVTLLSGTVAPSPAGRVAVGTTVLYLVSADAVRMLDVSPAQHQPVVVAIER